MTKRLKRLKKWQDYSNEDDVRQWKVLYMCGFEKKFNIYICICILVLTQLALFKPAYSGDYAADFLRIGVGARAQSMGGAFAGVADDASAFYWNPAGVSRIKKYSVHFDHAALFNGLSQYNAVSANLGFNDKMAVAFSWIRLGVEDIPRYGNLQGSSYDRLINSEYRSTGIAEGYFADKEDAVMVTFSRTDYFDLYLGRGYSTLVIPMELSFGITGKYIRQSLDDALGTGQGLDAGAMLRFVSRNKTAGEANSWLGLGIQLRDLSRTSMIWNTGSKHKDYIELGGQAGLAASVLFKNLHTRFIVSVDKEFGFYDEIHAGGEMLFFNTIALRAGAYDGELTTGAGLNFFGLKIDYAFISNDLDNTHRISGAFYF